MSENKPYDLLLRGGHVICPASEINGVMDVAVREYLLAREAACDAAVLRAMDAKPQDYGRLLLALGVSPLGAGFAESSTSRSFSAGRRTISSTVPAAAGDSRISGSPAASSSALR